MKMYFLYSIGSKLACLIPRKALYFFVSLISYLRFYIAHQDRQTLIYNLTPFINSLKERKKTARKIIENFAFYLVDFFRLGCWPAEQIKNLVTIQGEEYLQEAIKENRGVIFLTAHLGNYELGGVYLGILLGEVYALAYPHRNPKINEFFINRRKMFNVQTILTGQYVRKLINLLQTGKKVAFVADREFSNAKPQLVNMCGYNALVPRGPSFIAKKSNALILPTFFIRYRKYCYKMHFEKYIDPEHLSLEQITDAYIKVLEKYLMNYPEQWYMFAPYWQRTNEKR